MVAGLPLAIWSMALKHDEKLACKCGQSIKRCCLNRIRPAVHSQAPGEFLRLAESQVHVTTQLLSSLAAAMAGAKAEGSNALYAPLEQEYRKERQTSLQDLLDQAQLLHQKGARAIFPNKAKHLHHTRLLLRFVSHTSIASSIENSVRPSEAQSWLAMWSHACSF